MKERISHRKKVLLLWAVFLFTTAGFLQILITREEAWPAAADPAWEPIYSVEPGTNRVAFAVNVDWGTEYIPAFLEALAAHDAGATFFLTGRWASENPDVAKMIKDAGMEIGNHGYSHRSPNGMSYQENAEEIRKTEEAIRKSLGIKTTLFAPPAGEREDHVLQAAAELGYRTILWSADTVDWQKPSVDTIVLRVKEKMNDGSIVLMHPTENTVKALPALIAAAAEKGYRIVKVSELLQKEKP